MNIDGSLKNDAGSAAVMQAEQRELLRGNVRKLD
jgi:hypothetical protein